MTNRITRLLILVLLALFAALWHLNTLQDPRLDALRHSSPHKTPAQDELLVQKPSKLNPPRADKPVQLEAHIMSKCPDAKDCIVDMIVPIMSSLPAHMVNFTLSYIGQISDPDDGVECRHGPQECLGNILQLCAAKLYPDPKQNLGFSMCTIKQYELIPQRAMIQDCAAEYGIDFDRLNDCASREDGSYGMGLLRDSVERTRKAGVELSCTVRVDEKIRCIRDGGEWKDCPGGEQPKKIVDEIKTLYHEKNKL